MKTFNRRTCQICHKSYEPSSGCQKYCENCRLISIKETKKEYLKRYRAKQKKSRIAYRAIIDDMKAERFSTKNEIAEIKKDLQKLYRNNLIMSVSSIVALVAIFVLFVVK